MIEIHLRRIHRRLRPHGVGFRGVKSCVAVTSFASQFQLSRQFACASMLSAFAASRAA